MDDFTRTQDTPSSTAQDTRSQMPVARLSHTHEGIMNWMLANPEKSQRELADAFGYTQAWISRLIHSDLFQERLRARQEDVFLAVAQDIPAKLRGLADIAIEKVTELVAATESPEFAVDVFDKALNRLGYAPQRGPVSPASGNQTNVFVVSAADLADARGIVIAGAANENSCPALEMGAVQSIPSPRLESFSTAGQKTPGGEI